MYSSANYFIVYSYLSKRKDTEVFYYKYNIFRHLVIHILDTHALHRFERLPSEYVNNNNIITI